MNPPNDIPNREARLTEHYNVSKLPVKLYEVGTGVIWRLAYFVHRLPASATWIVSLQGNVKYQLVRCMTGPME